jgi:RNA polymerase sigma factor (sigma-70 family)
MLMSRAASGISPPPGEANAGPGPTAASVAGDHDLLQRYISEKDGDAFRQLVERYTPLVYAAARRQLRSAADAHLADDVTQAVFVLLAQKARSVGDGRTLPGWLVTTSRLSAKAALRAESRRRARERRSVEGHHQSETTTMPADVHAIEECVDEALCRLGAVDRTAVTLCYLQGQSHREVGQALGVSEDAASRRLSRAMAKLRAWFARRGMMLTPAALGDAMLKGLCHDAPAPPPALAQAASESALSSARVAPATVVAIVHSLRWQLVSRRLAFMCAAVLVATIVAAGATVMAHFTSAGQTSTASVPAQPRGPVKVGWYISAATAVPKPPEENAWFKMFRVAEEVRNEPNLDIVPLIEPGSANQPQQKRLLQMYFPGKTPLDVTDADALRGLDVIVGSEVHGAPENALRSIAQAVQNGTGLVTRTCLGGCRPGPGDPSLARMRGLSTLQSGIVPGPTDCVVVADHPLLGTLSPRTAGTLKLHPVGGFGSLAPGSNGAALIRVKSTAEMRNSLGKLVEGRESIEGNVLYVSSAGKGRIVACNISGNTPDVLQQATGNRFTARTILWAANRPLD